MQGAPEITTQYNSGNQLTTQTTTNAAVVGTKTLNAVYDAAGNLTQLGFPPPAHSSQFACSYEAMNDPVDCTVQGAHSLFAYDGLRRLIRVAHDNQNGATTSNESYVWCGDSLCAAFDNTSGSPVVDKLYFDQGVLGFHPPASGSGRYYYLRDLQGSVRDVTTNNPSAPIVARYQYDAYGNQNVIAGNGGRNDLGFAGLFSDANTGLSFARNRVYSPALGRWLSQDPIGYGQAFQSDTTGLQFAQRLVYNAQLARWITRDPIGYGFASPFVLVFGMGGPQLKSQSPGSASTLMPKHL